ncbi:MAG: hypothetical protein EA397_11145 [Deltaproteobacteria bacterium]|nr:MAG: hypothetical protein EA397_11145 [Deltaproteobacteria bacterium]
MKIRSESILQHPLERVYRAYRDEMPAIASTIPDIAEVRALRVEEREGGVSIHNEWISAAKLPPGLSKVVRPEHLRWDDFAEWNDTTHEVGWKIKTRVFTDQIRCGGTNRFVAHGSEATKIILDGELRIDIRSLPGVPSFVARKLGPRLESFFVGLITPNLKQVNTYLERYLDERVAKGELT